MNIDQIITILKKTSLFRDMSDSFLYALAFSAEMTSFSTGDILIKSSEKDIKALIIIDGRAFVQKKANPIELKRGSIIGMLALINNQSMKDPVIAGSKGNALILDRDLFDKLTTQFDYFPKQLINYIQSHLDDQIEELSQIIN
mgnify:CR=1 FL=1